jgi:hypothetical protein
MAVTDSTVKSRTQAPAWVFSLGNSLELVQGRGSMHTRDLGFSTPVTRVLNELRENLADLARVVSLEQIDAGKSGTPESPSNRIARAGLGAKQRRQVKMSDGNTAGLKHSDRIKPNQQARSFPQGYAEVCLATHWPADAESWGPFMRKIIRLPRWMLPAVQIAIHRRGWRSAADPLGQIRTTSIREAHRSGLRVE